MSQKHADRQETDIYNHATAIGKLVIKVKTEFSKSNANLILDYDKEMTRQSISLTTRRIHMQSLINLTRILQKEWSSITKSDVDEIVFKIMNTYSNQRGQETWTTFDLKKVLKMFVRWHKFGTRSFKEVGDPPETKQVKIKTVKDTIVREDLITQDELDKILKACGENQRDRAFIDCHAEAGTRPTEILNLKIKHVKFDKYGALLHVDGKTGTRPIRIIRSVPNLSRWLDVHPFKEDSNAPLWIIIKKEKFGKPFTYRSAMKMIQKRSQIAGINKKINLKLFRHSEATEAAKFMTESQLKKRHGWSNISRMPAKYVHMVNSDVDDAIFDHYGIKKQEEINTKTPQFCTICKTANPHDSTQCTQCGKPLDLKAAIKQEEIEKLQYEEKIKNLEERMNELSDGQFAMISAINDIAKIDKKIAKKFVHIFENNMNVLQN